MLRVQMVVGVVLLLGACGGGGDDAVADAAGAVVDAAPQPDAAPLPPQGPHLAMTVTTPEPPAGEAGVTTLVLPHFVESEARISAGTAPATDVDITAVYTGGLAGDAGGGGAVLDIYLYEFATGAILQASGGAEVCNPCTVTVDESTRSVSFSVQGQIEATGGFPASVIDGFALIATSGTDPGGVSIEVATRYLTSTSLLVDTQPIRRNQNLQFVIPRLVETAGTPMSDPGTSDVIMHALYVGGLPGISSVGGANLDVYLRDIPTGDVLMGPGGPVCDPCTYVIGQAGGRSSRISLEELIDDAGGFDGASVQAFGALTIGGDAGDLLVWITRAESGPE